MAYKRKKQITFDLDTKLMNDEKNKSIKYI